MDKKYQRFAVELKDDALHVEISKPERVMVATDKTTGESFRVSAFSFLGRAIYYHGEGGQIQLAYEVNITPG